MEVPRPAELQLVADEAATCVRCRLAETRTQVVFGVGDPDADLLFVGEGPGAEEDRLGEPFVGRSGKLLDQLVLEEMGLTRDQFHIANVVKCRPPDNRDPQPDEIAACNPWLERQLELIQPKVVVTLGNFAMRTLLQTRDGITKVRGSTYPFRGGLLIPTFHPAAILRGGAQQLAQMRADLVRAKQAIAAATAAVDVEVPAEVAPAPTDATLFD
ncbi:MAG TPA: uracil-DNA glycosylase [Acidimicrobiales bacterium]|nr:uracil-DNA glycosylase [Acidimicrobiales bacterium]